MGSSSTQVFSGGPNLSLVLAAGGLGRAHPPHAPLNLGLLFPTDLGEGKQRGLSGYKPRLEQQLRDRTYWGGPGAKSSS